MISFFLQVEDRGSAIKGPNRIDLYHKSHRDALIWGRRKLTVSIAMSLNSHLEFPDLQVFLLI